MTSPADHITPFVQTAYLVDDAKAAAHQWVTTFGAGPFFVLEDIQPDTLGGTDAPRSMNHTSAYGQLGAEMIELVQPQNGNQSVFNWPHGTLHHRAAMAKDYDAALWAFANAGMDVRASAAVNEMPFCFVDTVKALGHFVELYPQGDGLKNFYAMIAAASDGWDGTDPVRVIGS